MNEKEIRAKVRCGACQGKLSRVLNIVDLGRKATWKYPTGGNVLTGESGVACAIVCDRCIEARTKIVEAVEFKDGEPVYHPVETLEKVEKPGTLF